ncbi:glycosyl hydrolase [Dyadobacter sp. Leaf189]|uniref:glycosyl hydrolase n=1 Tax=Dyadobacter sp. Leaf189 TaxID=1736295 RepID=UPI0006F96DA2|nr:glycosyl hydrolase [Dyadobacter sp. Leaf189]KQS30617.1 glycoside hydrolase [Dyadobacter sp. Leaf189]
MLQKLRSCCLIAILAVLSFGTACAQKSTAIIEPSVFQNPTSDYGIRCWWWWLNGNIDKETITRDLEEMKAKGFSGACIFDAGGAEQRGNDQVPEGPMFGSPAWQELYVHAIKEADRLGLVMSMSIQSGWNLGGPDVTPAETAKQVVFSETKVKGGTAVNMELTMPEVRYDYYRDIVVLAVPSKTFTNRAPISDLANKAATREVGGSAPETRPLLTDIPGTPGEEDAALKQVINITKHFKNGKLSWKAPAGEWTILRMGFTPTDAEVSTSSGKWQGHVIDYLSEKNFNRYWDTHVEPLLKAIGPMAGKTLRYLQTDSFEAGGLNWTEGFEKEFIRYRGYDPIPYLPVLAGKIIENREVSNRFLADLRKTLGDLISEKHYGTFAKRAGAYGIGLQPESAGPHAGPFDGLKNYGHSEIMMSEFWSPSPHRARPVDRFFVKQAGSAAKIFNKKLVGAESFTTIGPHWNDVMWSDMKPSADHEFCAGLNLVYLHTFTASPKAMGLPGQEYFAGTHFNPNVTWWNHSTEFIKYLTRCQYLLQQGTSVADVLYYYGDHSPNIGRLKEDDPAGALPGFDYDLINEDRLLALEVKDGKLVLPHGVSYRVLALPDHKTLSLAALTKVEALVKAGATIIGNKTVTTASLVKYPASEQSLKKIADALWGTENQATGSRKVGKGLVVWGQNAAEYLRSAGVAFDMEVVEKESGSRYDYIHRVTPDTDLYFISSQNRAASKMTAAFRISGKQPELWNAVTGETRPAAAFTQKDGITYVPLQFDPYGSIFVVFKKDIEKSGNGTAKTNFLEYQTVTTLHGAWDVAFDTKWGGPEKAVFTELTSWTDRNEQGIKFYSGKAIYSKKFDVNPTSSTGKSVFLDLGEVKDIGIAKVTLNGKDLGILWAPPLRVNVSGLLREKDNDLQVEVVNTWRNRLIGDRTKPVEKRLTKTNVKVLESWQLTHSGLLGPVRVLIAD